jgi:hypothetical protein
MQLEKKKSERREEKYARLIFHNQLVSQAWTILCSKKGNGGVDDATECWRSACEISKNASKTCAT